MSLLKTNSFYNVFKRSISFSSSLKVWNKDWAPGPYPINDEERRIAAKKYFLLPEEYEPKPDDGFGAGDYPNFKPYSVDARDPFYPWDYPEYRRNFCEALQEDQHFYGEDRYNVQMRPRYSLLQMLLMTASVFGVSALLMYLTNDFFFLPMMPHHIHKPGIKHYTYESPQSHKSEP
ncbi:hypothetical protein O3M35_009596 [Rhynocoris fuscipes]|uniref:NADH dehydrogenase [ubiquinone] 1 beta subcomplex subunit 8, mitochondrial n=1 Tax=Rhynocoris fuscipes TaxID=488301 RepID=A0AAW1D4Z0_9HEMI